MMIVNSVGACVHVACFCRDINGYLVWRLINQLAAPILSRPFSNVHQSYLLDVEREYRSTQTVLRNVVTLIYAITFHRSRLSHWLAENSFTLTV